MKIKTLDIEYTGQYIISDIDDCLISTTECLRLMGVKPHEFFFNESVRAKYINKFYDMVELTEWGEELRELVKMGDVDKDGTLLMTASKYDLTFLHNRFGEMTTWACTSEPQHERVKFFCNTLIKSIYVDDKDIVKRSCSNPLVQCVVYPKKEQRIGRRKKG